MSSNSSNFLLKNILVALRINGDPSKKKIDYVNWIELIKFKETRNYVQRVLENANVYRYMLSGKPIKIYNFFEDKVHY